MPHQRVMLVMDSERYRASRSEAAPKRAMNLDDVIVFVTVEEHSSFSAAARKLGLSKVGVSRAISRLEASIGTPLLKRTSRHVGLTSAGREFRDKVKEPVTSLSGVVRAFSQRDLKPSRIRVGTTPAAAALSLASTLARFAKEHPAVQLELQQASALRATQTDELDVTLGFPTEEERAALGPATSRYVGAAVFQLFAAPSYLAQHGTPQSPSDLAAHSQVSTAVSVPAKAGCAQAAESGHIIACGDIFLARDLIRLGCGLGLLPRTFVEHDVASGALLPVLAEQWEVRRHLWLVLSPAPHLATLTSAFSEFVIGDLRLRQLVEV